MVNARYGVGVGRIAGAVVASLVLVIALMIATNVAMQGRVVFDSAAYLASTLLLAMLYHAIGGSLCAALACGARAAVWALVAVGTGLMVQSVHNTWPTVPPWYSVAMLVIAPVFLWLGTRLSGRREAGRADGGQPA